MLDMFHDTLSKTLHIEMVAQEMNGNAKVQLSKCAYNMSFCSHKVIFCY